jgi:type IV pilus assembly protein PilC
MANFTFKARDTSNGELIKSTVQAQNEKAAVQLIQSKGLSVLSIKGEDANKKSYFNKIKTKDRVLFARQLSTLINAGLPLVKSLQMVETQTSSKALKVILEKVQANVESGKSLGDSLTNFPEAFDNIFVKMVAAGEVSGTLDKTLDRLAMQQEKDAEVVSKIRSAMTYPLIIVVVMIALVGFMLTSVLPQVQTLYEGFPGAKLPPTTLLLLSISHFVEKFWWLTILILIIMFFAGRAWTRTENGRTFFDRLKLTLKPFSRLFYKLYMARFTRTGSTLIASGVPLIQMLEVTSEAINNVIIEKSIQDAIKLVRGGKSLSQAIENDKHFLDLVPSMIRIGEESGTLDQMMGKAADYYEKELDDEIKNISTIIEPVLMILLGVVALVIVGAVLGPIYGLAGQNLGG